MEKYLIIKSILQSSVLSSFQSRSFTFLWISDWFVRVAEQMEFVVLGWFVLIKTESPFILGFYAALRYSGNLLAPIYGIAVDRFDRKIILIFVRSTFVLLILIMLILIATDSLEIWQVFIFTGVSGMGRSLDNITRQAVTPDLVPRDSLINAVAMTSNGRNVAHIIGPLIGGILLSQFEISWSFSAIVMGYTLGAVFVLFVTLPIRTPAGIGMSVRSNLFSTANYISKNDIVFALLLVALLTNITALPLSEGLMPVFAKNVLDTGSSGLGALLSAYAIGGFIGSATIACVPRISQPGRVIILSSFIWHFSLMLFAQSSWFRISLGILVFSGLMQSLTMVTMSITLLAVASPEFRGRVMGVRSLAVYGLPIGLLIAGALANLYGAPFAITMDTLVGMLLTMLIAVKFNRVWRS